jgi:hypothetical protein
MVLTLRQGALAGFFYCSWKTIDHPGLFVHQWNVQLKDMFMAAYVSNPGQAYKLINVVDLASST